MNTQRNLIITCVSLSLSKTIAMDKSDFDRLNLTKIF